MWRALGTRLRGETTFPKLHCQAGVGNVLRLFADPDALPEWSFFDEECRYQSGRRGCGKFPLAAPIIHEPAMVRINKVGTSGFGASEALSHFRSVTAARMSRSSELAVKLPARPMRWNIRPS